MFAGLFAAALFAAAFAAVAPCDTHPERCVELQGSMPGTSPMPLVALGTWRGSYKDCAENDFTCYRERARAAVGSWLELGGTHIDGANDYRTQVEIGEALRDAKVPRESVFITTKCPGPMGMTATVQCAEDNLQMLGQYGVNSSGYIDLLLIHFPWVIKPQCVGINPPPECASDGESCCKRPMRETDARVSSGRESTRRARRVRGPGWGLSGVSVKGLQLRANSGAR